MGFRPLESKRIPIALACPVCGTRNYKTDRARRADAKPVVLKKFCPICGHHTEHVESK